MPSASVPLYRHREEPLVGTASPGQIGQGTLQRIEHPLNSGKSRSPPCEGGTDVGIGQLRTLLSKVK
jgi:hypothetical protein